MQLTYYMLKPYFYYIFFTFLIFFSPLVNAQELIDYPPAQKLTQFSFEEYPGGIIVVKAALDEYKDSLNFIFDTGNSGISLDSMTCIQLGLITTPSSRTIKGISGVQKLSFAYNHRLVLPKLTVDHLDFHINNYDLLSSVYGVKIDGIIGFSFLRQFIVNINYETTMIEVFSPGLFDYPKKGHLLSTDFYHFPITTVQLDTDIHTSTRTIFDIGAGLDIILSSQFANQSGLILPNRKMYTTQIEGIGGKKIIRLTTFPKVQIGPFRFKKVPVHIFDDENDLLSYPNLGGILGNNLLRRFNIIINYPNQKIHLKPNKFYYEPFDYTYSGLGIYAIDSLVTVVDIIKDSPSDLAGFEPGDVIVSINEAFIPNIKEFKKKMANTSRKVDIGIVRNNRFLSLRLKLLDIRKIK